MLNAIAQEQIDTASEYMTPAEIAAFYNDLFCQVAANDRELAFLLLEGDNLTDRQREALVTWGAKLESIVTRALVKHLKGGGTIGAVKGENPSTVYARQIDE